MYGRRLKPEHGRIQNKTNRETGMSSNLQIIAELETAVEIQSKAIKILAARLAELGDVETGRDEILEADRAYYTALGGEEDFI
jgi:hypothetical protein